MNRAWMVRVGTVVAIWLAATTALAALQMRPSVVLLALIVTTTATLLWSTVDLADVAAPVDWRTGRETTGTTKGADARVKLLERRLAHGQAMASNLLLHHTLVELIDERLVSAHGIDRNLDPGAAEHLLGAELAHFVAAAPALDDWNDPTLLPSILSRIEAL